MKELKGIKSEYYRFIAENPSSWVEFLPIKKYGKNVLFNLPLLVLWLFGGLILWLALKTLLVG